jgi:hypothetical protein
MTLRVYKFAWHCVNSLRQARQGSFWRIAHPNHCKLSIKALFVGPVYKAACLWVLGIAACVIVISQEFRKSSVRVICSIQ